MLGEFQAKVVQAISTGSMDLIHRLVIGKNDVNKFVFPFLIPAPSRHERQCCPRFKEN
jgi:hypothetical protein